MGGSLSAFKNNFLSNDKKKIKNSLNFAITHLQDLSKYHPELHTTIVEIFDLFKQVLDISNEKNTLSRRVLLDNVSIFEKLPVLKLEREHQRVLINKFTSSITLPIFKLTYVENEELAQQAFAALSVLSKHSKLTNATQFLKFYEDYHAYRNQNDKILRINGFMEYFVKLPPHKFDSRTIIDLFLRFIYQEICKEKNSKVKAVLFNHLTSCFRMKIDFQMSYIEGCLRFLVLTVEKSFSTLKEIAISSKGLKKTRDIRESRCTLREQKVDLFLLIRSAYDFAFQIISLNEPKLQDKYTILVNLVHRSMQYTHHFKKYSHIIISKCLDIMSELVLKCGPEQLHTIGNIIMNAEEAMNSHYLSYLSSDQGKVMQKSVLQFLTQLLKWKEIVEIPYWRRKFIKLILLSAVISFYTDDKEITTCAVELLKCLFSLKRSHFLEVSFVDTIVITFARYLYMHRTDDVKEKEIPSIYDMDHYFADSGGHHSAFSETVFEYDGESLLLNRLQPLFIFLNETEKGGKIDICLEHLEKIHMTMVGSIFDPEMKTPNIFGFIHQSIIEINQIEISNLWNKVFSSVLDGDFKKTNARVKDMTEIEKELNELKSKMEQLSCVICYEYLFDGTPISLQCGHLFCLDCIMKVSESNNKCPQCLERFDGWVRLRL